MIAKDERPTFHLSIRVDWLNDPNDFSFYIEGCFSGSAIELPDGRQLLMYTGVQKKPLPGSTFCTK